ncbi:hypothetical protein Tco_1104421, partial [Tanacetum coccineum]
EEQVPAIATSHLQNTQTPRQAKRGRDTEIPQSGGPPKKVGNEAVHKELGDRVERATTTAASLDTEQDSGNTPGSDEERLEHQDDLTDFVPPTPHDSRLSGGHTPGSDEDDKTDVLTYHKKLLAEAVKEKEELKTKLESFETSSKSLNKLLNSQLSVNDKAGFGHNGAKESKVCETITSMSKVETSNSETSNDKVEVPKIKTVRMSEPIIEEWESNSEDDEIVVKPKEVTKQSNLAIFLAE